MWIVLHVCNVTALRQRLGLEPKIYDIVYVSASVMLKLYYKTSFTIRKTDLLQKIFVRISSGMFRIKNSWRVPNWFFLTNLGIRWGCVRQLIWRIVPLFQATTSMLCPKNFKDDLHLVSYLEDSLAKTRLTGLSTQTPCTFRSTRADSVWGQFGPKVPNFRRFGSIRTYQCIWYVCSYV